MIPLKDDLPTRIFPLITIGFIILNIAAFFYQISLGQASERLVMAYGAIPYSMMHPFESNLAIPTVAASIFTSMFLHGDIMHLGGNMLYLWIFGNNIEDSMGHIRFVLFYLICGIIAVYTHSFVDVQSRVPMIGASGAVSGILGAYLLLFPRARILTLVPLGFYITTIRMPALILIGLWFGMQAVNAVLAEQGGGGVAWFAHVGGFLAGLVLIFFFKTPRGRRSV